MCFIKQNVVTDYEMPSGSYSGIDDKESNNVSPHSDAMGKNYSKFSCNDYEAVKNPDESAVHAYSNCVRQSVAYDDAITSEYSEIENADSAIVNDEEDIYSDPGHSEADIYTCFEKKRFRMLKRNDVR